MSTRRTPALSLPIVVPVGVPLHFGLSRARRVRKTRIGGSYESALLARYRDVRVETVADPTIQDPRDIGAGRVIAIDRVPERLRMAEQHSKAETISQW